MNPSFNPQPTFHANPDQNEMFIFTTKHGFAAVVLDFITGFQTCSDLDSLAQFGTNIFVKGDDSYYTAIESVPELVARYAEMKKRRSSVENVPLSQGVTTLSNSAPGVWKAKA